jgi:uncharacterized protein YndB with AHSA1/START domain
MTDHKSSSDSASPMVTLIVRKTIQASAERLFEAWTQPAQLKKWWGPQSVVCIDAEVDLRVGGRYRIANQFPDGKVVWIAGEFETIEQPHKLVYTWRFEPEAGASERVTVVFELRGDATEVIVTHERIPNAAIRDMHEKGWQGCLDGLAEYLKDGRPDNA